MTVLTWTHLVGMALLLGGGLSAAVVNRFAIATPDSRALDGAQVALGRLADVGAALLFLSGIGLVMTDRYPLAELYHQLWLVLMVLFGLTAAGLNGAATARTRRLGKGGSTDVAQLTTARRAILPLRIASVVAALLALTCGIWRISV